MKKKDSINAGQGTVVPDGSEIRSRRNGKGWSQQELAEKTGYDKKTIENIEAGKPTRITTLRDVAEALGTPLVNLVCSAAKPYFRQAEDSSSTPSSVAPPAVSPFRPQQLPADLSDFIGRADESERMMARLLAAAGGAVELSAVNGMGGVGKTCLAVRVGHQVKEQFPGGQLFLDLGGMNPEPLTTVRAMAVLLQSLCPEARLPHDPDRLAAEYRSAMAAAGRVLLVLDNAVSAEQVRPLLPGPPAGVIATSRRTLSLSEHGTETVQLDVLPAHEALALLLRLVGPRGKEKELREVVHLCGCLPLAVRVAGDALRLKPDWTVREYLDALRREGLRRLKTENDRDVEAVLTLSAAQLVRDSLERATRWALLAEFDGDFDRDMAATVWEANPEDMSVRDDLSDLTARSMLHYDTRSGTYRMHDLMRPIAAGLFGKGPHEPV